jgi:hypothetical protein
MVLQKRVAELENENSDLKQKLNMGLDFTSTVSTIESTPMDKKPSVVSENGLDDLLICPPVPPRESANSANQIFA